MTCSDLNWLGGLALCLTRLDRLTRALMKIACNRKLAVSELVRRLCRFPARARAAESGGLCKSRAHTAPCRGASAGPCLPTAQPLRDQLYSGRLRVVLRWIKAKALVPKSAPAIGKADDIGRSHRPGR